MASKSFFRRHPIWSVFLILLLIAGVGAAVFFATTPKEEMLKKGANLVMPDMRSMKMNIQEITADSIKASLTMRINNSLPMTIDIDSIQYKIAMEGDTVVRGYSREGIRIAANSNDEITVPVRTNIRTFTNKVKELERDSVDISVYTILYNSFPVVGKKEIPITINRTVFVPKLPEVEIESIKVDNLSFSGGKLLVNMKVTNYSSMPFTIDGFSYRFRMSDNMDVKGTSAEKFNFRKKGSEIITVPIDLKLNEVGEAAFEMLFKSESTPYRMTSTMNIKSDMPGMDDFDMTYHSTGTIKELKEAAKGVAKGLKE